MSRQKTFSELEIANKIKHGMQFIVRTNRERILALRGAKFLGKKVMSRQNEDKTFTIYPG